MSSKSSDLFFFFFVVFLGDLPSFPVLFSDRPVLGGDSEMAADLVLLFISSYWTVWAAAMFKGLAFKLPCLDELLSNLDV